MLKVHPSNYRISGFTESVTVAELAGATDLPVVADLGSGLLDAACPWLAGGPPAVAGRTSRRPARRCAAGAALVTFSGDKLLGGPQAGIIAGRADLVDGVRPPSAGPGPAPRRAGARRPAGRRPRLPPARLAERGARSGGWRRRPCASLRARATAIAAGDVVDCDSVTGGGTLPGVAIPSAGVAFDGDHDRRPASPRPAGHRPGGDGRTICDLRTVVPDDDPVLAKALASCATAL